MATFSLERQDVYLLMWVGVFIAVLFTFYFFIRLLRELIPTVRQVRRTVKELEHTIQNSQEIIYNLKSISKNLDKEVKEAHEILGTARGVVEHVQAVTSAITRPVIGLRNVLTGIGYGMKYLLRRNRPYEEEEI